MVRLNILNIARQVNNKQGWNCKNLYHINCNDLRKEPMPRKWNLFD